MAKRREDRFAGVLEFADAFAAAIDPTHVPRRPTSQPAGSRDDSTLGKFPALQDPSGSDAPITLDPAVALKQERDGALVRELQNASLLTLDALRQGLELVTQVEPGFTADRLIEIVDNSLHTLICPVETEQNRSLLAAWITGIPVPHGAESSLSWRHGWVAHQARRSDVAELKTKVSRSRHLGHSKVRFSRPSSS